MNLKLSRDFPEPFFLIFYQDSQELNRDMQKSKLNIWFHFSMLETRVSFHNKKYILNIGEET